jgi:hypothetical protein
MDRAAASGNHGDEERHARFRETVKLMVQHGARLTSRTAVVTGDYEVVKRMHAVGELEDTMRSSRSQFPFGATSTQTDSAADRFVSIEIETENPMRRHNQSDNNCFTRRLRYGNTSFANHGFFFIQMLFRGLG